MMQRLIFWYFVCLATISASFGDAWRLKNPRKIFQRKFGGRNHPRVHSFKFRGGAEDGDKDSSFITPAPFVDEPQVWAENKMALILMDTFAPYHCFYLAHRAKVIYGCAVIPVVSNYMKGYFLLRQPEDLDRLMSMCMPTEDQKEDWTKPLKDFELVAVACESDSGLADAERLSVLLKTTHQNGINEARRNKYYMIQHCLASGLPVVKQKLCNSVEEACGFASELGLGSRPDVCVVVKPVRGVGSEDVCLAKDIESVKEAFKCIYGGTVFGSPQEKHQNVLLQEFAVGQEYAIDTVSKDGEHKIAAVWIYDKRPANGASFVYYATKIYDGPDLEDICSHVRQSLDALEIKFGITHSEVIMTKEGCRLVEVNCRQHNMDFLPLVMRCIGYNVFDVLLAAYFDEKDPLLFPMETEPERLKWDLLPPIPSSRMNGAMVHLVNYANGTLTNLNEEALTEIQEMKSVLDLEVYPPFLQVDNKIFPTVDIRTDAGWVQMVNPNDTEFQRDYDRIIELMPTLFDVKSI
jgi:hypothetical protein